MFLSLMAVAAMMAGCGSSKDAAKNDYQYQQWKAQQEQKVAQGEQERPLAKRREVDPCIELANAESENWRAYGTSTSYVEKVALNEAARDARNSLANMMKVAIEGAAQDYEQNASENIKNTAAALGEAVMSQYVVGEIERTKIIKTSIYDLTDGTVQVYVCVEMKVDKEEFEQKLNNVLERDKLIEMQYDRERFIKSMAAGLEEYKQQQNQ